MVVHNDVGERLNIPVLKGGYQAAIFVVVECV